MTDRGSRVLLVSSETFTNDLIEAIRDQSTDDFRARYRDADALFIDDVHFIAGKESTQQEFFHTFNAVHDSGGQIVMTSDRPPQSIATLEDRLRSRFQWGLQVDIQPPDLETRIAILQAKAERHAQSVPRAVVELIADTVQQNVRELEGALNRVVAYAQYNRQVLTVEVARQALADLMLRRDPPPLDRVLATVAQYFGLGEADLTGRSRSARISEPRQIAMYLMREETDSSYPVIGATLGGRDHTTILHGCEKIGRLLDQDAKLRRDVMQIRERLY
jgi:chromosomal replication initiator protein